MEWIRRKNKRIIEEQNKENKKNWEKHGLGSPEEIRKNIQWDNIQEEIRKFRESNVDEDFIKNWLYSHLPDGRIKLDGKFVWICQSCETARKFDSKDDYIAHQMSYHS